MPTCISQLNCQEVLYEDLLAEFQSARKSQDGRETITFDSECKAFRPKHCTEQMLKECELSSHIYQSPAGAV